MLGLSEIPQIHNVTTELYEDSIFVRASGNDTEGNTIYALQLLVTLTFLCSQIPSPVTLFKYFVNLITEF